MRMMALYKLDRTFPRCLLPLLEFWKLVLFTCKWTKICNYWKRGFLGLALKQSRLSCQLYLGYFVIILKRNMKYSFSVLTWLTTFHCTSHFLQCTCFQESLSGSDLIFIVVSKFVPCYNSLQVIAAEGEKNASRALKDAADIISETPQAIQLRYLQTLTTISAEKNSTIIFPLPVDFLSKFLPGEKWLYGRQNKTVTSDDSTSLTEDSYL